MIFEKVEALCRERGISISRLEKECGFGNATIRGWKQSDPGVRKVKTVADYFGVTLDYFVSADSVTNTESDKKD